MKEKNIITEYVNPLHKVEVVSITYGENSLILTVENINRCFDFQFLSCLFGQLLSEKIAYKLAESFGTYARRTSISRYSIFKHFCIWIAESKEFEPGSFMIRNNNLIQVAGNFERAINIWGEEKKIVYEGRLTTLGENVNNINSCFKVLQKAGLLPIFDKFKMPKNYHYGKGRRKSLAELDITQYDSTPLIEDLKERIKKVDEDIKESELEGLIASLLSSHSAESLQSDDALVEAMQRKTTELLETIRNLAEEKVIFWRQVYEEGQCLLKIAKPDSRKKFEIALAKKGKLRTSLYAEIFPGFNLNQALANFLYICQENYGGIVPSATLFADSQLFDKLMIRFGGKFRVGAMLNAHTDAVVGAMLMYLVDSGANVSVVRAINAKFEIPTDEPGWYKIASVKVRAGYKPIVENFPETDTAFRMTTIQALRFIEEAGQFVRSKNKKITNILFFHCLYSAPSIISEDVISNRLRYFLRDANFNSLCLTPGAIRPSYIIKYALLGNGDILTAQVLADHAGGSGVTETYALRWPIRMMYIKLIREYTESLEHQLFFGVEDASKMFGVSEFDAHGILKHAIRTGIGVSCRNPLAGVAPGSIVNEDCTNVSYCHGCEMKIFHITQGNLLDVLLVREHLVTKREEYEALRAAKWEKVYLPMLAFAEVVIEKVGRSRHAHMLKVLKVECDKIINDGWVLGI